MKPWGWIVGALVLYAGAVLDQSLGAAGWAGSWMPQLAAGAALAFSLCSRPAWAAVAGFLAALLTSALPGASLVHHALPLILACYGAAHANRIHSEVTAVTAAVWIFAGSLLVQAVYLVLIAPGGLLTALLLSPVSAALTACASTPVYALLSRSAAAQGS